MILTVQVCAYIARYMTHCVQWTYSQVEVHMVAALSAVQQYIPVDSAIIAMNRALSLGLEDLNFSNNNNKEFLK